MKRLCAPLIAVSLLPLPLRAKAPVPDVGPSKAVELSKPEGLSQEQLELIDEVARKIQEHYISPVNADALLYRALQGMASGLDAHSRFFDPKEFQSFLLALRGGYSGVGISLGRKTPVIRFLIPGGPAQNAGLQPGDRILSIDGTDVKGLREEETQSRLLGEEGSKVVLGIRRDGCKDSSVTVERRRLEIPHVLSKLLPSGIGYVYISSFRGPSKRGATDSTDEAVRSRLRSLKAQGMRALILDLRENGGGAVPAAVNMAAFFLEKDQNIVSTKNGKGAVNRWTVDQNGEFTGLPVAVLVNGHSASASEILAGALRDNKHAVVVGSRSYGKGSAQALLPLPGGTGLKLTVEHWYAPSGRSIQGEGILPDVVVEMDDAGTAAVMDGLYRELLGNGPAGEPPADPVLEKAVELLR